MDVEGLRVAVYRAFVEDGRPPSEEELAARCGVAAEEVTPALVELHARRHLVLDGDGRTIMMAHPFSSIPLGFSVMGDRTLWWGGCAWDAFAMPHLLPGEHEVLVATTCPACGAPHAWVVNDSAPPPGGQLAHFLVPVCHMWDDVVHTCGNQRIFCDGGCVVDWLDRTGNDFGYVMDLPTLWRLAAHWYDGRLQRGYERRQPEEAKEYFADVGLTGPFWEG